MAATFDADTARRLDRLYGTADVVAQRKRTREVLAPVAGEHVVDVGCGPGHLACDLAGFIGESGRVTAIDASDDMLALAEARAHDEGMAGRMRFMQADAVGLPLPDDSVDAAVSVQVLEFVTDVARALSELRRVVSPAGRLVIVDTDWRSCVWHSDDRDRTDRVLRAWETFPVHPHLPTALPRLLRAAGFAAPAVEVVAIVNTDVSVDTYSLGMLRTISSFAARNGVPADEADAWERDIRRQAERGTYFFSLCRYLFSTRPVDDHS